MFIEKKRKGVPARALTVNGTSSGLVTVASILDLFVKQKIIIKSNTKPPIKAEIKRFISDTQFYIGAPGPILDRSIDISAYLVADGAEISAEEQDRPGLTTQEHERAVYAEEPIVAKRVILVDNIGDYYTKTNPVPVQLSDGSVNIGTVNAELEVQLSHKDDDPDVGDVHDSVRVGDGTNTLDINNDGSVSSVPGDLDHVIANISAPVSATEYSYTFPAETKGFALRVRDSKANVQIAFISGQSGTNFFTVPVGRSFWDTVNMGGKTVYFQLDKPSKIVEILSWVKP